LRLGSTNSRHVKLLGLTFFRGARKGGREETIKRNETAKRKSLKAEKSGRAPRSGAG